MFYSRFLSPALHTTHYRSFSVRNIYIAPIDMNTAITHHIHDEWINKRMDENENDTNRFHCAFDIPFRELASKSEKDLKNSIIWSRSFSQYDRHILIITAFQIDLIPTCIFDPAVLLTMRNFESHAIQSEQSQSHLRERERKGNQLIAITNFLSFQSIIALIFLFISAMISWLNNWMSIDILGKFFCNDLPKEELRALLKIS